MKIEKLTARVRWLPIHPQWLVFRGSRNNLEKEIARLPGRVLDVGCNDMWPRSCVPDKHEYVGLDFPGTSVRYGYRPSVYGDVQRLPFLDASFDAVFAFDVLEHVPGINEAFTEIARVLKTGGHALIQIPFAYPLHDEPYDFRRLTRHGLDEAARQAGLDVDFCRAIGHPLETACAGGAIACAVTVRSLLDRNATPRGIGVFLALLAAPLAIPMVLAFNLLGLLASALPGNPVFPMRYVMRLSKPE